MKIGDIVRHKVNGTIGICAYSTFGLSINFWNFHNEYGWTFGKTPGDSRKFLEKRWEVIDLPSDYEMVYGAPKWIGDVSD